MSLEDDSILAHLGKPSEKSVKLSRGELVVPDYISTTWGKDYDISWQKKNVYRDTVSGIPSMSIVNRAMMKLSIILNIFPQLGRDKMKVCDMCGGPGSWSRLLFRKYKNIEITGITKQNSFPFRWYEDLLGNDKFTGIYTDIVEEPYSVNMGPTFDLVVGDGGDGSGVNDPNARAILFENRLKIMCYQLAISHDITKIGGSMVLKMFNPDNIHVESLVNLTTKFYDNVHVIKPLFSRESSTEFYLVCIKKHKSTKMTRAIYSQIRDNTYPIYGGESSEDYKLFAHNVLAKYYNATNNIKRMLSGKTVNIGQKSTALAYRNLSEDLGL